MNDALEVEKITLDLRRIARSGIPDLEAAVSEYLNRQLSCSEPRERLRLLETLYERFERKAPEPTGALGGQEQNIIQLVRRLCGGSLADDAVSSGEILEKLAGSLDLLFHSLNEIISVINVMLFGQNPAPERICKVNETSLERGTENLPITEYLDQIRHAFVTAHISYQIAAETLIAEVLSELDPAVLLQVKTSGLKFGPLRKADLFDIYKEKHARCSRLFDSGQYKESLLLEFEKNCRRTFKGTLG